MLHASYRQCDHLLQMLHASYPQPRQRQHKRPLQTVTHLISSHPVMTVWPLTTNATSLLTSTNRTPNLSHARKKFREDFNTKTKILTRQIELILLPLNDKDSVILGIASISNLSRPTWRHWLSTRMAILQTNKFLRRHWQSQQNIVSKEAAYDLVRREWISPHRWARIDNSTIGLPCPHTKDNLASSSNSHAGRS